MTPASTWTASATQGVFGGIAPRNEETTSPDPAPAPAPAPSGPLMSLSISAGGLLEFVFQQLYTSVSGEEAERIRAVLAPQYAQLAQHLQAQFGGAEMVGFPDGTQPPPTTDGTGPSGSGDTTPAPRVAAKSITLAAPAIAPSPVQPLTETQVMAVVAANTLLSSPVQPSFAGASTSTNSFVVGANSLTVTPLDASVPEPATWGLMGVALALLVSRRRR